MARQDLIHWRQTSEPNWRAFTLTELLIVIAIIAVLIALLLPMVASARRQAITIRCAASLGELYHGFELYATEYDGYWPPSGLGPSPSKHLTYSIGNDVFPINRGIQYYPAYWQNFIAKYVTRSKQAAAVSTASELAESQKAPTWGCQAWPHQFSEQSNAVYAPARTGYGINASPRFPATRPPLGGMIAPYPEDDAPYPGTYMVWWPDAIQSKVGAWFKKTQFTRPSERALLADGSRFDIYSNATPPDGTIGPQLLTYEIEWAFTAHGQTTIDLYRHGRTPPKIDPLPGTRAPLVSQIGGRVCYNILYCDGHVTTHTDPVAAFRSIRMRYPG